MTKVREGGGEECPDLGEQLVLSFLCEGYVDADPQLVYFLAEPSDTSDRLVVVYN